MPEVPDLLVGRAHRARTRKGIDVPENEGSGPPPQGPATDNTTMYPIGDQTDLRQFTRVNTEIASMPGVLVAAAIELPADQRRVGLTYVVSTCPRCTRTHLHRALGLRRPPCGSAYVVVEAVDQ